jgi:hypothetical protein
VLATISKEINSKILTKAAEMLFKEKLFDLNQQKLFLNSSKSYERIFK